MYKNIHKYIFGQPPRVIARVLRRASRLRSATVGASRHQSEPERPIIGGATAKLQPHNKFFSLAEGPAFRVTDDLTAQIFRFSGVMLQRGCNVALPQPLWALTAGWD
jgi:hypothetical protein